ncbi:MAG: hydrogenase expression/formation protein HypE [Mobiluncus porci]|uniref:Hydrogenase expression/formation protein HypE n=1 Tax=Mobiluncus porci TaxID=2652278 RepID=A0A7K0K496_9ACTO|nr:MULTISPECIES: hydrogenase expression/formation protein HypE [Mobiluncus]MCI6584201.1 hydrogenase expression/formation protein HypE [Mobiluncus sp.]MDD7541885.1 hydrogenase expression/formation protein HypE [Mobiluncus porci]MDY5749355.1 hydrogenase expression/formation protein HypE [Mobiluncus porci]MST50303.1 hydrogenase expression/formation protein HypE [Mobiluncus porci]
MSNAADEATVLERIERVRAHGDKLKDEFVTLAHGAGGKASAQLVEQVFVAEYGNDTLNEMTDAGVMGLAALAAAAGTSLSGGEQLAFSTDSYVVNPIFFPGGSIGDLAVNGTVNDLSVSGAVPYGISAAFVIEEGLEIDVLRRVVADMHRAADRAGVKIVTGDTKVVAKGAADKLFITTAGVGIVPASVALRAGAVSVGDAILVSGPIADHGMAVMLARGDLALAAPIETDSKPVNGLTRALLEAAPQTRWMRDATRGGLGTVLNELAKTSGKGVAVYEEKLVVREMTRGACDILGIDPLYVANEGMFVAVVPADEAEAALSAVKALPGGEEAALVGKIVAEPASAVVMVTGFGGTRMVDMLVGDPLPRIC